MIGGHADVTELSHGCDVGKGSGEGVETKVGVLQVGQGRPGRKVAAEGVVAQNESDQLREEVEGRRGAANMLSRG